MTPSSRTRRQLAAWGAATLALPGGLARAADWPTRQATGTRCSSRRPATSPTSC
jgi:hypothetical protein